MNHYLIHIQNLQNTHSQELPVGVFPCSRENKLIGYKRFDDCIFATASILLILNELKHYFSEEEKQVFEKINNLAQAAYPSYQNKDGLKTYNFWKTKPSKHFPNGYFFKNFKHFKLPDDIDDTALVYLTHETSEAENKWLKNKLTQHSGNVKVYSTWFGKNMPLEKDVCALCNLMYWIFKSQLPLNDFDKATLQHLQEVIVSKQFISQPFYVSRHYASVPLIIYHYARLMYQFEIVELEKCKHILIQEAFSQLSKAKSIYDNILLLTSLLKLGVNPNKLPTLNTELPDNAFYSFIGALLAPYSTNRLFRWLSPNNLFRINWKCPAHEYALMLEYSLLNEKISTNPDFKIYL